MAELKLADNVIETSTTTGTGTYSLGGAANSRYRAFLDDEKVSSGDEVLYAATDDLEAWSSWEFGYGTITSGGSDTLTRNVISSSNSNNAVSWGAGTKYIFSWPAARKIPLIGTAGELYLGPGGFRLDNTLRGHLDGLQLRQGGDSDHDIIVAAGAATLTDGSDHKFFDSGSGITKQIDANWSEGSGAGGFPSGLTLSTHTWYHVFLIGKNDGSIDAGFDTDTTASNLLADAASYSWYRRLGSVKTDASSNIIAFTQAGDVFLWDAPVREFNDSDPGTTAQTKTLEVPTGVRVWPIFGLTLADDSPAAPTYALITSPDQTNTAPSASAYTTRLPNTANVEEAGVVTSSLNTNASGQLRIRLSNSDAGVSIVGFTYGWHDPRGRTIK